MPVDLGRMSRRMGMVWLISISWAMGFAVTAVAVAISPEAHSFIAALFCDGEVGHSSFDNSLRPGERTTVYVVYCTDAAGQRRDITFPVFALAAPVFYGCIVAAAFMLLWRFWIGPRLRRVAQSVRAKTSPEGNSVPPRQPDTARRLAEARALHESGAITEEEHEAVRARILGRI